MPAISADRVIPALQQSHGNVAAAAKSIGVLRSSLSRYIGKHPAVKTVLANEREVMLDNAESVLYRKVLDGEAWAVCFFLKTQGKTRGYVERSEVTGADGGAILMKWPEDE